MKLTLKKNMKLDVGPKKRMLQIKVELDKAYKNFCLAYDKFKLHPSIKTHDTCVFSKLAYEQKLELLKEFCCVSEE